MYATIIYSHIPTLNYIQICSGLDLAGTETVNSEVKVTVTWKHLVTRQGPICIDIPNMDLLP